jgi:hypothetical protein
MRFLQAGMSEATSLAERAGRSEAPLNFSWLGVADADLKLGFDRLHYGNVKAQSGMLTQLSGFDSRSKIFFRANYLKTNESR